MFSNCRSGVLSACHMLFYLLLVKTTVIISPI